MRWNLALACALALGAMTEMMIAGVRSPVLIAAGLLATGGLAVRGRAPVGSAALTFLGFTAPVALTGRQLPGLGHAPHSISLAVAWLVAAYTAGTVRGRLRALAGLLIVLAACLVYAIGPGSPAGNTASDVLAAALFSGVVPWLAGAAVGRHRRARDAERKAALSEATAAEERARIAREVHDLVAHSVSLMVVQAEAAEALLPSAPERTAEFLRAVQAAGRDALGEMRRTVTALRSADHKPLGQGLADLPILLDRTRRAGLPVTMVTDGAPSALNPDVEDSAFRVVQEGLTNALRHSDHAGVAITLRYRPEAVEICVLDEGRPVRRRLPGGHGLGGLGERIAALGGTFDAGTTGDGGHLVHAVLPMTAPS